MIIDVHAHPILEVWREAARAASGGDGPLIKDGMVMPDWSPALAVEVMDANGIDAMVLSAPSGSQLAGPEGSAALARAMNDELAEVLAADPKRFGAFAVLPLYDVDEALEETRYALDELGFDGVGLLTSPGGVYLGDPKFEPLFAELDRRKAVAFVHPDTPVFNDAIGVPFSSSILEFMFETTRAVASLIYSGVRERYPNFDYIAAHGGGTVPFLAQRLGLVTRVMPTGYGQDLTPDDVARLLRTFHFDVTAATTQTALTGLLEMTSTDRLLTGFDFPYMPSPTIAPAQRALETSPLLDDAARRKIHSTNALALLPRLAERLGVAEQAA